MTAAKVKVQVLGSIGKAVFIDPQATRGAQIGTDLRLPDGSVPTLEQLAAALGVSAANGSATPGLASTIWRLIREIPNTPHSVIGTPGAVSGIPVAIAAAASGSVLTRQGNQVLFTTTPVWEGNHTWLDNIEVRLGTGGDLRLFHDGANSTIRNDTGQLNVHSDAAMALTAVTNFSLAAGGTASIGSDGAISLLSNSNIILDGDELVFETGGTERARFDADGALLLDGDPGAPTEVVTSNGPGLPATWEPGGAATKVIRGASWVSSSGALTSGVNIVYASVPFAGTITKARLLTAGGTGSCVVDVRMGTYAGFPTVASIAASAKPTISSGVKYEDSTLTGWTTAVSAGDILAFVVESTSTFTQITIELELQP